MARKTQEPPAIWPDAARTIELAETIPRSVKRGRGIDLHQEEFSELGTFRGTMASLGCGIIILIRRCFRNLLAGEKVAVGV